MVREIVEVLDVRGNRIAVRFNRKTLCDNCKASSLCGSGTSEVVIEAKEYSLVRGDLIEVGIEERATVFASLLVFCVPVFVFIGALLFFRHAGELASFGIAFAALAVYYVLILSLVRRAPKAFEVRVIRKI
jgi:positive regulator of sigma E activity